MAIVLAEALNGVNAAFAGEAGRYQRRRESRLVPTAVVKGIRIAAAAMAQEATDAVVAMEADRRTNMAL